MMSTELSKSAQKIWDAYMHPPAPKNEREADGTEYEGWQYSDGYCIACMLKEVVEAILPSPYVGSISAPHEFSRRRRQLLELAAELEAYAPYGMHEDESSL